MRRERLTLDEALQPLALDFPDDAKPEDTELDFEADNEFQAPSENQR
jgi:hypothetical protein